MNNIYLRFTDKANDICFDVLFDIRLSFVENFELLGYTNIQKKTIYDEKNSVALNKEIAIKTFHLSAFYSLSIY